MRQFDVAADRRTAGFEGAAIGGFHDARAAASDHRDAIPRKQRPRFLRRFVFGIVGRRPRRTEDRDAVRDMRQVFKALDELAHDAENAPGIGVEELIAARRFQ